MPSVKVNAIIEKVASAKEEGCLKLNIITQELTDSPEKIALLHLLVKKYVCITIEDENEETAPLA